MYNFFRRKNLPKPAEPPPVYLPPDFALEVLNLQGELDLNCSLEQVKRLIQLYSSAIEQFESVQNPKHLHYQERLQSLLKRKDVIAVIKNPNKEIRNPQNLLDQKKQAVQDRKRLLSHKLNHHFQNNLTADRTAQKTLKVYKNQTNSSFSQVKLNLKNQCIGLEERLRMRIQKKKLRTSFIKSDKSEGQSLSFDEYQDKVEELMEKLALAKMEVRQRIQKKYQTEMEEFKSFGDFKLLESIFQEMKKHMQDEISQELKALETKKREELKKIRLNY